MKTLLLLVFLSVTARANDFLPNSFSADYEQSFLSSVNGKTKKSFGRVDYKFPKHIRFEAVSPDPSTFVANPRTSWFYTPPFIEGEEGTVVIQRSEDLVYTKFFDSLKNGAQSNKAYTVKFEKTNLILKFSPALQKDLQMDQVILTTKSGLAAEAKSLGQFKSLELFHSNGKRVTLKLLSFKVNPTLAADHFEFKIPAKTKVSTGK